MSKHRCEVDSCKKKLDLTAFPCKCQKYFCAMHRGTFDHCCPYDYIADGKKELLKTMSTAVVAQKLEVI